MIADLCRLRLGMLSLFMLFGLTGSVHAQAMSDPTLAPPAWLATQPAAPGTTTAAPESPPEMQMVLVGRGRKLAIIDEQIVKVGDEFRGSKVLAIQPGKVVMEDAMKSLTMTPDVVKSTPTRIYARKKRVELPAGDEAPKAIGSSK